MARCEVQADVCTWPRYESVYQRLFLPRLLQDAIRRFGPELAQLLGGQAGLFDALAACTYRELHGRLLAHLPGFPSTFDDFKDCQSAWSAREHISVPLVTFLPQTQLLPRPSQPSMCF
jgi:hypothetical protein